MDTRRVRMTKRLLKDAYLDLWEAAPHDKITVTELCSTADVNRSTFYSYYKNPNELAEEMEKDFLSALPSFEVSNDENDAFASLERGICTFLEYTHANKRLFRFLTIRPGCDVFVRHIVRLTSQKFDSFNDIEDSVAKQCAYEFCVVGAIGLIHEWLREGCKMPTHTLAELIVGMTTRAFWID